MTKPFPLTLHNMLYRARTFFPNQEVVSRTSIGVRRSTYKDYYERVCKLANLLRALGVGRGDRVATLAWNNYRHLEAYFAVPCMGAVLHTVNFRLPAEHLAYILNHAEDTVVLVDPDLVPVLEAVRDRLTTVKHFVILEDAEQRTEHSLVPAHNYEVLMAGADSSFAWPTDIDELEPAGLCYTSATTGNPKGVMYSHRAIYLHTMSGIGVDSTAIGEQDTVMPVVPMFHVNAWGTPFMSVWTGAKLVLPGARPLPKDLVDLIQSERVTTAAGVPTVWFGVLQHLEQHPTDISCLKTALVGGSAAPPALIHAFDKLGVRIVHAYGMTEAVPITHVSRTKSHMAGWSEEERLSVRSRQGLLVPGLEMRVVDDAGHDVPWDGNAMGEIWLRGAWVASEYYKDERSAQTFIDGWYHSGDVAAVDSEGYTRIVDRTKDVVKSGGEWISSVDLENHVMAHPSVAEATVVGIPHSRWVERPLVCAVLKPEYRGKVEGKELLDHLRSRFPSWWVPDDVVFIDEIPKTGTGKFDKKVLRHQFRNHYGGATQV